MNSATMVELVALSPKTTRVSVAVDITAKSLSARLLLQSLKLAKGNLNRRFARRVTEQVRSIEDEFKRGR
jgi:hypothetical protein